jgi:hypothetical protein
LKATTNDTYTLLALKPPPPNVGNLTVTTNPLAHIVLDGSKRVDADANGKYTFEGLPPGPHTVDVSLDKFVSVSGKAVQVQANQYSQLDDRMEPMTPTGTLKADQAVIEDGQSASLTWQVNNASSVALDGSRVDEAGTKSVSPNHTTTYQLSANNGAVPIQSVTITVHPKPVIATPQPVQPTLPKAPTGPDQAELMGALKAYTELISRAAGKNCKAVLSTPYGGQLKYWTSWCDESKSFEAKVEKCGAVQSTPDAATLSCTETDIAQMKQGSKPPVSFPRTYRFAKLPDGTWQFKGW